MDDDFKPKDHQGTQRTSAGPSRWQNPGGPGSEVIVISDDSEDESKQPARTTMPSSSRTVHPIATKDGDFDDDVVFVPDRSTFRAKRENSAIFVRDSPPNLQAQPSPRHDRPAPTSVKRDASPEHAGSSTLAAKRTKTEVESTQAAPEWTRFMTVTAEIVNILHPSLAVSAGDELHVSVEFLGTQLRVDKGERGLGFLLPPAPNALHHSIKEKRVQVEAYALGPPQDSRRIGLSQRVPAIMDLKCRPEERQALFNELKMHFPELRRARWNDLPAPASDQAALARATATLSGSTTGGMVSNAVGRFGNWMDRVQGTLADAYSRNQAAIAGAWDRDETLDGPDGAYYPGAIDWDSAHVFRPNVDPNDDDEDEDRMGIHDSAVSDQQNDVMRGLAGNSYHGRNALSALYDEDATLDVAMLSPYPYLDSLKGAGLKTDLKHHQSQGLAWMIRAEHPLLPRRKQDGFVMLWRAIRQKNGGARYNHLARPGEWQRTPPTLPRGGILSDDMGLGKTLQVIALCLSDPTGQKILSGDVKEREKEEKAWLKRRNEKGKGKAAATSKAAESPDSETEDEADAASEDVIDPLNDEYIGTTLVVCPLSVIYNWVSQIEEHTDHAKIKCAVYHGESIKKIANQRWSQYDFIITTYDTVKSDFKPIDAIRSERSKAEARRDEMISLQNRIDMAIERGEGAPPDFYEKLDKLRQEQQEALSSFAANRPAPSNSKLAAAFAKGKTKLKGKGVAKKNIFSSDEAETDFQWSPNESDSDFEAKPVRAFRKGALKDEDAEPPEAKGKAKAEPNQAQDVEYDFDELFSYELPKLLATKYRRLVLDEAHVGRNSKTLLHRAVLEIPAERVWCVTGTPLINTTKDLQSLCAFLKIQHLEDRKMWSKVIEKAIKQDTNQSGSRLLRSIIFCTTLRRTKDMRGPEGKSLIELPPIQLYKHTVELDPDTRAFYDEVAAVMRSRVQGLWQEGELANQYSNVLLFLCRLRQICCSRDLVPANLLQVMRQLLAPVTNPEDMEPVVELDAEATRDLQEKLRAFITTGSEECPICLEAFKDARITPCSHVFCFQCISAVISSQAKCPLDRFPLPLGTPLIAMPQDEQVHDYGKEDVNDEDEGDSGDHKPSPPAASATGRDSPGSIDAGGEDAAVQSAKIDQLIEILRTTERTSASLNQPMVKSLVFSNFVKFLDKVAERLDRENIPYCRFVGSMNKTKRERVLRSFARPIWPGQYTASTASTSTSRDRVGGSGTSRSLLDMLDQQISRIKDGENDELADGELGGFATLRRGKSKGKGAAKRDRKSSSDDDEGGRVPLVMLLSIQAGAVGLNLTAASQVFILDPWWQGQIEAQAIDRVHRIGQMRDVKVFQFICSDTVEQRVVEIQEEKEELIRNSFAGIKNQGVSVGRDASSKKESTIRDILRIFGITNAEGQAIPNGGETEAGANAGGSGT